MKELIFDNGNLMFTTDETIIGFENKLVNALQIYGVETFYDIGKGLNFDVISSNQTNYKLQHIKSKILEWFGEQLDYLDFSEIKIVGKIVKARLKYKHKTLGEIESEVIV